MRSLVAALVAAWAAFSFAAPARALTDEVIEIALPGAIVSVWVVYPDGYDPAKPIATVLAFPPGAQDLDMVDANFGWFVPEAMQRGWLVIGPAAPPERGFARVGRALIGPLLEDLLKRFPVEGGKFHLAGQSNGGNSAFAAALDFPDKVRTLTVIPGAPPDEAENANLGRLAGIPIHMFVGERDRPYMARMTATAEALERAGNVPLFDVIPGGEHVLNVFRGRGARALFDLMEGK